MPGNIARVVRKAPQLVERGRPDLVAIDMQPHAARKAMGGLAKRAILLQSHQKKRAPLIGRKGDGAMVFVQPQLEIARRLHCVSVGYRLAALSIGPKRQRGRLKV